MATVTGTKNADTITVKVKEVVIGKGKNATGTPISKSGKNYIIGDAGKDTIYVTSGNKNYIYGDDKKGKKSADDKITISGGNNNTIYGGKGKDTFTVSGGKKNNLYGDAGNDVFVIGKDSTGTAVVQDFSKNGNDKVKVNGEVRNISVSGKNVIVKGGKSASLTLKGAKSKTFTVTETATKYNYKVSKGKAGLTLGKGFTGTFNAPSFLTTIDARKVPVQYNDNFITINGNAKANTIYVSNEARGYYYGKGGKDTIHLNSKRYHEVYGDDGNDTIYDKSTSYHEVHGGAGKDKIYYYASPKGGAAVINGDGDDDTIHVYGDSLNFCGGGGKDTIIIEKGGGGPGTEVNGEAGDDVITVKDGSLENVIRGGAGSDTITVSSGAEKQTIYTGADKDFVTINGGGTHSIWNDGGDDIITVNGGSVYLTNCYGNETVNIKGGSVTAHLEKGDDKVNIYAGNGHDIQTGIGNDTITINGGNGQRIDAADGNDTINVTGGNNHTIIAGNGNDTITITGGDGHTISNSGDGHAKGTKTIRIETGSVTVKNSTNASENISVVWSEKIGNLSIYTPSNNGGNDDRLTIKGAKSSDFDFTKNSYDLVLTPNSTDDKFFGSSITIENWSNWAFSKGIYFDDGLKTLASINSETGFTS